MADPATDTVVDRLATADVGPAADRSWAVDGALWICDGSRLHRYDPVMLASVSTIELGFDCGQVYATEDLVIPWTYNQDAGEVTETIEAFDFAMPLGNQVNSLAVGPGALWIVKDEAGILQRFDRPT